MPNQLNFPDPISATGIQLRPSRVSARDLQVIRNSNRQIIFGTSDRDVVELWLYNPNGTFAGHINVGPTDEALTLTTLIDQTGPYEILNIDLTRVYQQIGVLPGRYAMVANFFRNEVGSEDGYKLYITEISDDRRELRLFPVAPSPEVTRDLFEFIVPSVPRLFAKGLIDQFFGVSLDSIESERVDQQKINSTLNGFAADTTTRIQDGGLTDLYTAAINDLIDRTYTRAINLLAADVRNFNVQQIEIEGYIMTAFNEVLTEMQSANQFSHLIHLT